jgi:hypothetical protein
MQAMGGEKLLRRFDWLYNWQAPALEVPSRSL